eukprot:356552-Chlamydomonas_euryale.AAC.4
MWDRGITQHHVASVTHTLTQLHVAADRLGVCRRARAQDVHLARERSDLCDGAERGDVVVCVAAQQPVTSHTSAGWLTRHAPTGYTLASRLADSGCSRRIPVRASRQQDGPAPAPLRALFLSASQSECQHA